MKLIIDIDDDMYKQVTADNNVYVLDDVSCILLENAIANGIPLVDIKADIRKYENDCMMSCVNNDDCRDCNDNTFESIYKIIDKHIESEDKE